MTTDNIFAEHALRYYEKGISIVPLRVQHKAPIPNGWQAFCSTMPSKETVDAWIKQYPNGNIGLPLGPANGLVAIDLDTDDPKITALIESLIPPTEWKRRGAKGAVYLYKSPASAEHRTFRIKDINGKSLVECLAKGTQCVLPPSIHPDTKREYTATANLYDVINQLPALPKDIETIIRGALSDAGIDLSTRGSAKMVEWVAAGARDSSMVSIAGLEARAVIRGERTLNEAFGEMETWIANFTEKVVGDSLDPEKAKMKIVEFIKRDLHEGKRRLPAGWDEGLSQGERDAATKEFGEDHNEWSLEQCYEFIEGQFEEHDRKSPGRSKAVEAILRRVANSKMSTIDREQLYAHVSGCSAKAYTVLSQRKRVAELEQGEIQGTDHAEIARALLNEHQRYGEIRRDGGLFWQWRGSHYAQLAEKSLLETLANDFGTMPAARRYSDHRGILRVAENLVPAGLHSSSMAGINFANGFLSGDLTLHPHDPKYGCKYVLPYVYDAEGPTPQRFLSFLHNCWGEDADEAAKVNALRQAMAATLYGQAWKFQRATCFFGQPDSGKSVLKSIALGLMPEGSVCTVRPHDWNDKFLPTEMYGKLLNECGELSETEGIAGDRFKAIVDGDEIAGQYKGRDIFRFKPICAHWLNSNHIPKTKDSSGGFSRRWLFLTFNKPVPKEERVVGLASEILAEERAAIAGWAVQAFPELLANNDYTLPQSHEELVGKMASLNNSVRAFLCDGPVHLTKRTGTQERCTEKELHDAYFIYCRAVAHTQPCQTLTFRARLDLLQREFGVKRIVEKRLGRDAVVYEGISVAA